MDRGWEKSSFRVSDNYFVSSLCGADSRNRLGVLVGSLVSRTSIAKGYGSKQRGSVENYERVQHLPEMKSPDRAHDRPSCWDNPSHHSLFIAFHRLLFCDAQDAHGRAPGEDFHETVATPLKVAVSAALR